MGRHLPYGITLLPATRHKWTLPALTPARRLALDLPSPEGWKAWVDLGYPAMERPVVELAISISQVRRPDGSVFVFQMYDRAHFDVFGDTENWWLDLRSWCLTWRTTRLTYHSFSLTRNGDEPALEVFFFTISSRSLVSSHITLLLLLSFRPGSGSPSATNVVLLLLGVVVSTKAFSFHNRSSLDFACRLVTTSTLSTIASCQIFKLSRNYLILINF